MRTRRSKEEAEKLCAEWKTSGLTQKEFCKQKGLHHKTLTRWRWKLKRQKMITEEFPVKAAGTDDKQIKFLPLALKRAKNKITECLPIKLTLHNGICLKMETEKGSIANLVKELL